ncbi:MAG: leucine-rich repeat domain-containing protein [Clostridia bacterium]|nr:leucine-rich repeat domain-containing protein [Clostridia bacterium]
MQENNKNSDRSLNGAKKDTFTQNTDKKVEVRSKEEIREMRKKAEKIKGHYFRTFYYAFAMSFIIFGLVAVLYFVYTQDKNIFGFSDRYYEQALESIESHNFEEAEKALVNCLEFDPTYEKARTELIELYEKEQKFNECEALLEESIKMFPRREYYYKKMISVLTAQNKISEAIQFSENISSSYIVTKLTDTRPSNVNSIPDPGTYDSAISVKLTGHDKSTVYYTTDGSAPTKNSKAYDPAVPIIIEKGTVTIRAVAINDAGLISDEYNATYRIYNANTAYIFLDEKIEQMVRVSLNKPTGTIYYRELENIKQLSNAKRGDIEITGEIQTLNDLLVMPNLSEVALYNEPSITDFSPIFQLKQLSDLTLSGCNIDDATIKRFGTLVWLSTLNIDNNIITDISFMKNMSILKSFSAANNMIKDISVLSTFTNLKELNLSNNLITEIDSLSALTSLKKLDISYNLVSSLSPMSALTSITELNISGNTIKELDPIARLTKIQILILSDNPITTLSALSNFTSLEELRIDGSLIVSLSEISGIESLKTLDCSRTSVTDFTPMASMKIINLTAMQSAITLADSLALASSVEVLNISTNNILDVTPFTFLENLKVLNISNNPVTNIGVLTSCKELSTLSCANVPLTQADVVEFQNAGITLIQSN